MTTTLDDIDFESALFEPLEVVPEPEADEEPPRRRRGRPLGSRNRTTETATARRPGRPPKSSPDKDLAAALADPMTKLGVAVSFGMPTVGAVIAARADVTTTALVRFAADRPRMLDSLRKISKAGPGSEIVETVAMCVIAAQLDMGKMSPDHPIGKLTGVSAMHLEIMGHIQAVQTEQAAGLVPDFGLGAVPPPGWDPRMMGDPTNPMFSFAAQAGASVRN